MVDKPEESEDLGQVDELTPEEASRIIHSHRKVRYGKCPWYDERSVAKYLHVFPLHPGPHIRGTNVELMYVLPQVLHVGPVANAR